MKLIGKRLWVFFKVFAVELRELFVMVVLCRNWVIWLLQFLLLSASQGSFCIDQKSPDFSKHGVRLLFLAFVVYVRPTLRCCMVSTFKTSIEVIEKVQRHFTKTLRSYKNLAYEDRLQSLVYQAWNWDGCILSLSNIYCYKIVFGLVQLNFPEFFVFSVFFARGHAYKLYKLRCNGVRTHLFTIRVLDV